MLKSPRVSASKSLVILQCPLLQRIGIVQILEKLSRLKTYHSRRDSGTWRRILDQRQPYWRTDLVYCNSHKAECYKVDRVEKQQIRRKKAVGLVDGQGGRLDTSTRRLTIAINNKIIEDTYDWKSEV